MKRNKKIWAILMSLVLVLTYVPAAFADDDPVDSGTDPACIHEWSDWITVTEPSCGEDGLQYRECSLCFEPEEQLIPATGEHIWSGWSVVSAATIKTTGINERYCVYCGKTERKGLPKIAPFVRFTSKTFKVAKGKSLTLKPSYARGDKVKSWKSSKKSVATVSKNGKIVGKKTGKTTITVTMQSGKKAACTVKVVKVKKKSSSKVYWVPNGSVYHKSKNCRTLKRSKVIKSGTIQQSGKKRACKVCG